VTGIEDDQKHNVATPVLQIFPNPAKTSFTIRTTEAMQNVQLYDVLGKLIRVLDVPVFENERVISLTYLSAGVYFVKVITEQTETIRKVVVTK